MLNGIFITLMLWVTGTATINIKAELEQPISVTIPRVADTRCLTILDIARLVD
jgi:hypothetical protein